MFVYWIIVTVLP